MSFDERFVRLVRRLRKMNIDTSLEALTVNLRRVEGADIEVWREMHPWILLLLVRWVAEYGRPAGGEIASVGRMVSLVNRVHDLAPDDPFLNQRTRQGLKGFLRRIGYQQFWLQRPLTRADVGRDYAIFHGLADGALADAFKRETGLTHDDFSDLMLVLWSWLVRDAGRIGVQRGLYENVNKDPALIDGFLKSMSTPVAELAAFISGRPGRVKKPFLQIHERTPLLRRPMLEESGTYFVPSLMALCECFRTLPVVAARENGGSGPMEDFGRRLERYVGDVMAGEGMVYYREDDVRRWGGGRAPDYVVPLPNSTLIVEVKGTEMRPSVAVNPTKEALVRELRGSAIKGIAQGLDLAGRLGRGLPSAPPAIHTGRFFIIVVSYRPLLLGSGPAFWDEFVRDSVRDEYGDTGFDAVPPENMWVISLPEYETLMGATAGDPAKMEETLVAMSAENAEPLATTYEMGISLWRRFPNAPIPKFVAAAYERRWTQVARLFRDAPGVLPTPDE